MDSSSPHEQRDPTAAGLLSGRVPASQRRTPNGAPGQQLEITELKNIPSGQYLKFDQVGMPEAYAEIMVVLRTGETRAVMLVAPEEFAGHKAFDAIRRLKEYGFNGIETTRAVRGVIKAVHGQNQDKVFSDVKQTDIERLAWALVENAVEQRASDIHVETRGTHARVFFRIDGLRVRQADMSKQDATAMANVLYGFHADAGGKEVAWDPDSVKESSIEHMCASGTRVQLRFITTPIHPASEKNFQLVMRVLIMENSTLRLPDVGYASCQQAAIEDMLVGAQGMVVLVGPTNSGKSTSMQAFMNLIMETRGETTKPVTVEDPVEYIIEGACQMGVPKGRKGLQASDGSIFTTFLKATLRLDPDMVLVGEIRDRESAASTKDLVLAGRKLLTTLHVFEVLAVYARLRELGVPPSVLYMEGFISGVIYQRLVPVLCQHCAIPLAQAMREGRVRQATADRVHRVLGGHIDGVKVRNPQGCEHCGGTGIFGRTPCAAVLVPTPQLLALLRAGEEARARALWLRDESLDVEGFGVTAIAHAVSKMRRGLLDPTDIENQIGPIVLQRAKDFDSVPPIRGASRPPETQDTVPAPLQ